MSEGGNAIIAADTTSIPQAESLSDDGDAIIATAVVPNPLRDAFDMGRAEAINYDESLFGDIHSCGMMNKICQWCTARHFTKEMPNDGQFNKCCRKGAVKLPPRKDRNGQVVEYPAVLRDMLCNPRNPYYKNFRKNIRSYNSALSFASMGAKMERFTSGPYVFKIHGQVYHSTSHLTNVDGRQPAYAQLYVIDSEAALDHRLAVSANEGLDRDVLRNLDEFIRNNNVIAQTYQMMREVMDTQTRQAAAAGVEVPLDRSTAKIVIQTAVAQICRPLTKWR